MVYRPPTGLDGLVDELIRRFTHDDDSPDEHQCPPGGRCDHTDPRPLLVRVRTLIEPGTPTPAETKQKATGARAGSPAPWDAAAGEFLDEVERGALALNDTARRVLGFGPLMVAWRIPRFDEENEPLAPRIVYRQVTRDVLGSRAALADLPALLEALQRRHPRHYLVVTPDAEAPERRDRDRPGDLEKTVRGWHHRALLLTGHKTRWPRLGQVPASGAYRIGPVCTRCRHTSCIAIREARPVRWQQARCPYCSSPSLRQNPTTGAIVCVRPSCKDDDGRRYEWSVDELQRLGLVLVAG